MSVRRDDLFISCDCLGPERSGPRYVLRQFIAPFACQSGYPPSRAFSRSLHLDVDADLVDPRAVIF